jgi:peptide/nickel transport system permease protein
MEQAGALSDLDRPRAAGDDCDSGGRDGLSKGAHRAAIMIAYIIRRILYGIPILLGVNIIVFFLFFYVNKPDDIARAHLGKRPSPERIDEWKRQHGLDVPYFINDGWRRIDELSAAKPENKTQFGLAADGEYRFKIEEPNAEKEWQARKLEVKPSDPARVKLPPEFNAQGILELPADGKKREIVFQVLPGNAGAEPAALDVTFTIEKPSPLHRIVLEYHGNIGMGARFTDTIFFQRSLKTLFFDYGKSDDGKVISEEVLKRIAPSLSIAIPAFIFGILFEIFFAMIAAFFRGTYFDYWGVTLCVLAMSISGLFYILGGQVIFGKYLKLVPISGYGYGMDSYRFVALPIAILVFSGLGAGIRFQRTIFLEEINKDYVRTARAKGLPERWVLFIHVLKNAMLPILTGAVVSIPFLFTGNLILESFFAVPGMGSFTIDAISRQDFAIVQAMVSLGSFLYVIALIMTDISYTIFDPRVRLG